MVNIPTWIHDRDSHSPALLDLFLQMLVFVLQWLCLDWEIRIMWLSQFPSTLQDTPFHHIACDYSCANRDGLRDHLRDVPWEDIFKLDGSTAASQFSEWVLVGIDVYTPQRKYQVKPHSSPWFSPACVAAIVHRNLK